MKIPRNVLETLLAADVESTRYALGGVQFSVDADGKPWAAATDSRWLIACTWDDPGEPIEPSIVRASDLKQVHALAPDDRTPFVEFDGKSVSVGKAKLETDPLEGRFPRWPEVIPADDKIATRVYFDVKYIVKLAAFLKAAFPNDDCGTIRPVEIAVIAGGNPIRVSVRDDDGTVAVITMMSVEPEGRVKSVPVFAAPVEPKPEKPKRTKKPTAKKPAKKRK